MQDINTIKVSVVVPIYNVAPYLDKLISSIIGQTHHNIEVILVDDGSPDNAGEICDRYAAKDSRIIVMHIPNGGGCEARNKGMARATGEYITFIDGDDWVEPDYVEYMLSILLSFGADMALTDSVYTTRDMASNDIDVIEKWTPERASTAIVRKEFPVGCWNKMYRLKMIRENHIDFSVPWSGEGLYFATMSAQHSNCVAKGHKRVYHYRLNNPTSCITLYDVQTGINALWNIKNIGRVAVIRTPTFMHAVEWHIWENYQWLVKLIVATDSRRKYLSKYLYCRLMMIVDLPKVALHNHFSVRTFATLAKRVLLFDHYASSLVSQERELLAKDMETPQQ